jgi:hypothetical protein
MVQKQISISAIALAVAGILIMAILANQALAYSSYKYKSYKGHHGYKTSKYTRHGNVRASNTGNVAQESTNTGNVATSQGGNNGNAAQGASNTGQGGPGSQPSSEQGGTSSQASNCKPTITLSAAWYPPYQNYMIRGTLTCGGSGLSGKTITLISSKLSYVGALGTVVTREDGSFYKSYKPASTAKP